MFKFGKPSSKTETAARLVYMGRRGNTGPGQLLPTGGNWAVLEDNGSLRMSPATRTRD